LLKAKDSKPHLAQPVRLLASDRGCNSILRGANWLRILICAVPFCRQTPLTLKALRAKDYSENPQNLGEHLKKRRRELGLLQREAAERMGIQRDTYVNWEKDKTSPVASQFRPVVAFLGYDPTPRPKDPRGASGG